MADLFISYSKREPEPTQRLAAALRARGYSVWWDTDMLSGQKFREVILKELTDAKAVIVIWTRSSVKSDWVISEAERAREMGKLIPVRSREMGRFDIPQPFDVLHTDYCDAFDRIYGAVKALIDRADRIERILELKRRAAELIREKPAEIEAAEDGLDTSGEVDTAMWEEAEEENCWYDAVRDLDYEVYLQEYPEGTYAEEARSAIEERDSADMREEEHSDDEEKRLFDRYYGKQVGNDSEKKKKFWPDD